jgi:hypothetical protein
MTELEYVTDVVLKAEISWWDSETEPEYDLSKTLAKAAISAIKAYRRGQEETP